MGNKYFSLSSFKKDFRQAVAIYNKSEHSTLSYKKYIPKLDKTKNVLQTPTQYLKNEEITKLPWTFLHKEKTSLGTKYMIVCLVVTLDLNFDLTWTELSLDNT